ncbi:hypothetical protein [Thermococcus sp. Bubb.Bath]|uniref:hypothetical protein n=1 Tax=Thermococcus sp. Bubb.Bath TaxID=1638242 RepID=UPI00143BAC4F|nr:hypothetical protein [Thermococcus sp. Bubb.Bath]NJF24898.1 hypothetical protein [Thermococcus sp. Bubb.Bath]
MVIIEVLKCEHCGASLEVTPEDIIVVCPYCGYPNAYDKIFAEENVFFVDGLPKKEILHSFNERVRRDKDFRGIRGKIHVVKVEGVYVPLWFGRVSGRGYIRFVVYEKKGDKKRLVTKHQEFKDESIVCISGRRGVYDIAVETLAEKFVRTYFGFKNLKDNLRYMINPLSIRSLTPEKWEELELEFLNTDFKAEEAKLALLDMASDLAKKKHVPSDGEVKGFRFEGEVEETAIVFYPLWKVYYEFDGGTYFVAYDGRTGKEILAVEPVRIWRKMAYLLWVLAGILISTLSLTAYGNFSYWRFVGELKRSGAFFLVLPALGAYLGFELAKGYGKKMARDVRVER